MAKLLRDGGYSYDQSKHLIAEARRRVGLTPPQRKKGSVDRLTREELKALRRAACLLSLRPLSIGRFERSSECEARSIRKTTARSSSSLISAQSAGTTLCSTGSTSPDQSWSRRETPELYRIRLHVSACYPQYEHRAAQLRAGFDIGILQHLQAVSPALSEEKSNVRSTDFFWRPKRSSRVCWGGSGVLTSRHERARTQSCCSTARGTASECNTVRTADPGPALPNPLGIWHAADNRAAEPSFPCGWKGPHWFWWSSPPPTIESPTAVSRGWPYRGCELLRDENPPL